ncbi:MAG: TonB-dependent receptor [Bacteroidetes bacterium]|nr:TonB-dependent receptor [Bacteroidota bacterium]
MKKKLSNRAINKKSLLVLLIFSLFFVSKSDAQTLKGQVINVSGTALPGATITNVSLKVSVVSNDNGEFSINGKDGDLIECTMVGYKPQVVNASLASPIIITLSPNVSNLDEVVVIGYGTQKKVNLSGSVATVSGKTIAERPAPNLQNLLQGRIVGLDVVQPTGEPGRDNGSFRIRGLGSYGASSSPLVLVDGVIGSISNLSPQDIESVTVLKDAASASIYGSRAANGVILITTKKGKAGKNIIEYTGTMSTSEATKYPDLITNSVTYMEMYNAALARSGRPARYTQAQIDLYKNNPNSDQYPNFNWLNYVLGKGPIQQHNLAFSGGSDKTTYNLSLNYMDQKSITKGYNYKRYNALLDLSTQANKRVKVGTNINFSFQDAVAPWLTNDNLLLLAYASAPTFKPFLNDGSGRISNRDFETTGGVNRTVEEMYNTGTQITKSYNVNAQAFANVNVIKGLNWYSKAAVTFFNSDYKNRQYGTESYAYQPLANGDYKQTSNGNPTFFGLQQTSTRNTTKTFYSTLNYTRSIADHNLNVLAGYEQQNYLGTSINGARYDFPNSTIMELNGSSGLNQTTGGTSTEWALRSLFGRINYDYKQKYYLEGNFRYDGTSRVDPKYRWGTFGGGSAAWKISSEDFIKDITWINNLKLRASYGTLGNQEIGNYPYQDVLSLTPYPFTSLNSGAVITRLTTKDLKWEKTSILDFGLDIDIFNGLFGATIDWYKKNTTDILAQRADQPASLGLGAPIVNAGAMQNKGIEIEVRHQNTIGDFSYSVSAMVHRYRNKVTKVLAETLGTFEVGQPYNNFFMYEWVGIFQSQDEIDKWAKQPSSGTLKPGDLKIKDVDGNGTVGPEDRVRISSFPDYTYSFNLSAGWKRLNLTAFFQGVQGQKVSVNGWGYDPYIQGAAPPTKFLNAWTPTNPSNTVPAVYINGYAGVAGYNSTYFLQDASYLRLKNLYLSYNLPESITKKIFSQGVIVFVSGDNLITWTKYEGNDPERAGSGRFAQFPQLKIYSAGINIKL